MRSQKSAIVGYTKIKILKGHFEWGRMQGVVPGNIEQFRGHPMAISDDNGLLYEGQKRSAMEFWRGFFSYAFLTGVCVPDDYKHARSLVIDAMFVINTPPTDQKWFATFSRYLFTKWVLNKFSFIKDVLFD